MLRKTSSETAGPATYEFHPVKLSFFDEDMERRFREQYVRITLIPSRMAHLLAISLYTLFGFLDPLILPDVKEKIWLIRGGVCILTAASLAATLTQFYYRHHQAVLMALAAVFGVSIWLMLFLAEESAVNKYYAGLILVVIANFTMLGLRFVNALAISCGIVIAYWLLEWGFKDNEIHLVVNNTMFLLGAAIVSGAAGYTAERHLRRLFRYQVVLEGMYSERQAESTRDALTELLNRRGWEEVAREALLRDRRNDDMAAIIFLDLDGFKPLNDEHGHRFGDHVLCSVAGRLLNEARKGDAVGRFGGDEFVVMCDQINNVDNVQMVAERILSAIREPIVVDGVECRLGASIGGSVYPRDGETLSELVRAADRAMYTVKRSGAGGIRFSSETSATDTEVDRYDP